MSRTLVLRNRQRTRGVNRQSLRRLILVLVRELLGVRDYELGIHLVGARAMTRLNEAYLGHGGSTDVITFDYGEPGQPGRRHGEIFVCLEEAVAQARRFRTTWQSELVRYVAHGLLHLSGYDDRRAPARRRMKREEDRLVRELRKRFEFRVLSNSR
jgi:probable rRNA maturation factor